MPLGSASRGRDFLNHGVLAFFAISFLTGCQLLGPKNRSVQETRSLPVSATWYRGEASTFKLPTTAAPKTSREDLFRLVVALDSAYVRMSFEKPYPGIRIVGDHHHMLLDGAIGSAAIERDGREYIYINRDYLDSGAPLTPLVIHELSHLQAWRIHGLQIAYHGREYREICRAFTARSQCKPVRFR